MALMNEPWIILNHDVKKRQELKKLIYGEVFDLL